MIFNEMRPALFFSGALSRDYFLKLCRIVVILFVSMAFGKNAGAITSNFNVDKTSGCAPLIVNFSPADPACPGCNYSWNFGTGSPVNSYTASSSFLTVGTHVVTLTVTSGSLVSTSTRTITVHPSPTVNFTADDTAFCPGGSVTLTNTSTNGTSGAATIRWSLGDGDTAITNTVTHAYMVSGYYNVALTITNSQGCAKTHAKTTFIHVYNLPAVRFTQNKTSLCNPPGNIVFTNTTTGATPFINRWKFGDGDTSALLSPTHSYTTTGSFFVSLRITDANGCTDSVTGSSYIAVGAVNASFSFTDSVCVFAPVSFTNTSTTHTFRQWIFGDGETANTVDATHAYTAAGTYSVKLVAGFSPCIDTEAHVLHVVGGPPGGFTQSPEFPCPAKITVTYTSTAPPGTTVDWLFEKQYARTGPVATNLYQVDSIVHIRMIKTDQHLGCKDTLYVLDTLYDHIHFITSDTDRGCAPFNVTLKWKSLTSKPDGNAHPYPFGISSITWNFGDGPTTATGDSVTHTYTDTGVYAATTEVHTGNGCVIHDTLYILVGRPPAATFTASPLHACKTDTITFLAAVTSPDNPVDSFIWDFGDFLTYSQTEEKKRPFTLPGVFTVTMTPCNNGCCGDTVIRRDYITIDSPGVTLFRKFNCPVDRQVLFFDSSLGNDSTIWSFGDGDTAYVRYPAHTYSAAGTYGTELIAINKQTGCIDRRKDTIYVADPHPYFFATTPTLLCESDTVKFYINDTTGARISYRWIVADTVSPFADGHTFEYIFRSPGRYSVHAVTWDDNDCHDTVSRIDYVTLGKPTAGFSPSQSKGCIPLTVTLTDTSLNVAGLTTTSIRWDFGDGDTAISLASAITHTYTAAGTYTVREVVTNSINCKDTTTRIIIATRANPAFLASNVHPCINGMVTFNNTSPGIISSRWSFGDGDTSAITSPTHSYDDTGSYTVRLVVVDTNSCTDTAIYHGYVSVTKPYAAFTVDDTVSVCIPFLAQFHSTSTGTANYSWTFGDTHSSLVPSPTNNYTVAGIYPARLITTSIYGCTDTATQNITVYGYPGSFSYTPMSGCSPLTVHFSALLTNVPSISWDFADGVIGSASTSDTASHTYTTPGAYVPKLILSNNAGCVTSAVGLDTIKVSGVIAKIRVIPDTVCPGAVFSMVDSSKTFWSPITTWSWTYDGNTSTVTSPSHSISTPGSYPVHLQVTNGWGCTGIKDTSLFVIGIAPITGDTNVCSGFTTTLASSTSGGTWSSGATAIATVGSTGIVTGITGGTAIITYARSGCFVTRTVSVHQTPPPITGITTICSGTTTTLSNTVAGGTWSTSAGSSILSVGLTTGVITGTSAGVDAVSYFKGGCYATTMVTVNISPSPIAGHSLYCSGTTSTFTNTIGGGTWESSDTSITKITAAGIATGIAPGTAIITYSIATCYTTIAVTVNNTIPEITGVFRICAGTAATLSNATPGGTWSSASTSVATVNTSSGIVSGIAAGTSYITYSLGGGCIDTAIVTVLALPDAGTIEGLPGVCLGSSIALSDTAAGGTWGNKNTHTSISSTGMVTGLAVGKDTVLYNVSNTDCAAFAMKEITVHPLPDPGTITNVGPFCVGAVTTLTVTPASTGTWSSSNAGIASIDSNTATITTFSIGSTIITYIIAADVNGCRDTAVFTLSVAPPAYTIGKTVTDVKCFGGNEGSILLTINGTPPFEYLWSNGTNTPEIKHLAKGTYAVTVSQPASQCTVADSFVVSEPDSIVISPEIVADTCQLRKGSISVVVTGGVSPYTYSWSDSVAGNTGATLTGLLKGTYTLTLTDANGCIDTASINVLEGPCNNIVIYDVITPNGDGMNENWVIDGISGYPNNTVQIFDKWGDLVYEQQGYKNDWYGQSKNGGLLPDGIYYYVVKLNELSKTGGETEFAGTIMVKR